MNLDPIVIIGGGFVGLPTARQLAKAGHKVTLINPVDGFLFTPRLIDALAGIGNPATWTTPLSACAVRDGFTFAQGTVTRVNRQAKTVSYTDTQGKNHELAYGSAIVCAGTKVTYYNIPGAEANSQGLKSLQDVEQIHTRLQGMLQQAINDKRSEARERHLSVVVVGAGAAGIEAAAAIKTKLNALCAAEDVSMCKLVRITVIQGAPQILPGFPLPLVHGTERELKRSGISLSTHDPVTEVRADGVMTTKLGFVPASLIIWCAGTTPNPIPIEPEVHRDPQGNILVDRCLRADANLFAAGDGVLYREKDMAIPKNAQTALMMASNLGKNIIRLSRDRRPQPFRYASHGSILWLGRVGFLSVKGLVIRSRLIPFIRDTFYLLRFWESAGKVR